MFGAELGSCRDGEDERRLRSETVLLFGLINGFGYNFRESTVWITWLGLWMLLDSRFCLLEFTASSMGYLRPLLGQDLFIVCLGFL